MKTYFFLFPFFVASAIASPEYSVGSWQCKAEGYDRFNQRWEVESGRHIVIWEAESDAIRQCREIGYRDCRVFYCSDSSLFHPSP